MPHASMVLPDRVDPKDLKETKLLKEIKGLLDLKAIRVFRDPRAILVNPSQLLNSIVSPPSVHGGTRNWYCFIAMTGQRKSNTPGHMAETKFQYKSFEQTSRTITWWTDDLRCDVTRRRSVHV